MKQEIKASITKEIEAHYENTAGLLIQQHGMICYEQYFHGCEETSYLHVYSVSKSVVSILIGIALDKGYIRSIEQPILEFFPDYQPKRGDRILSQVTLRDIMSMIAPYKYKEGPVAYIKYFMSKDWVNFVLGQIGGKDEIGKFRYTPLIGPDLLTGILMRATGMSVLDFAKQEVFDPMAITVEHSITLKNAKEQKQFNEATNQSGWVCDAKGVHAGGWGLTLSVADMAKLGQLFLNDGVWEGKRIVSSEWIKQCTCEHSVWQEQQLSYGYLWWIINQEEGACAAMGDGGNVIYFHRKKELVIASNALFIKGARNRIDLIQFIEGLLENETTSMN